MQRQGEVRYPDGPPSHYRASVWIQQEIAILLYRSFLVGKTIPMRLYLEGGIEPEGLTQFSMINPIRFKETQTILEDLGEWLQGATFQEPPVLARREDLFRRRVEAIDEDGWLILELIAAHCQSPDDAANSVFVFRDYQEISREKGSDTSEAVFKSRLSKLIESGLVTQQFDKPKTGTPKLHIEKQ